MSARGDVAKAGDVSQAGPVAVLEIEPSGHRLQYLRHLVDAAGVDAAGTERAVVLTTAEATRSEEYALHAAGMAARLEVLPDGLSRADTLAAAVGKAIGAGARRLVIPDGDLYLLPLLQLMLRHPRLPLEIRLLLMRTTEVGGPEPLRPATLVKPVLVQLLRPFRQVRIHFLTDALGVVTRRRGFPGVRGLNDPVLRTADPAGERPAWFPPADPGTTLVGVFGVISARKNLPLLVAALEKAPSATLVVGGRLEPDVHKFVESDEVQPLVAAGRIVVRDQMLGQAEFGAALGNVDVAAVLHDNDAPSGILAEACIRLTPVLVPLNCWLARVVQACGLGEETALDGAAIAVAIENIARNRSAYADAARRNAPRIGTHDFTGGLLGP